MAQEQENEQDIRRQLVAGQKQARETAAPEAAEGEEEEINAEALAAEEGVDLSNYEQAAEAFSGNEAMLNTIRNDASQTVGNYKITLFLAALVLGGLTDLLDILIEAGTIEIGVVLNWIIQFAISVGTYFLLRKMGSNRNQLKNKKKLIQKVFGSAILEFIPFSDYMIWTTLGIVWIWYGYSKKRREASMAMPALNRRLEEISKPQK